MSVIDLEAALEFWEMKEAITACLVVVGRFEKDEDLKNEIFNLINKIESLGKKENLDEK